MAIRKTHEQFVSEVSELVGNEYEVLSPYQTTHAKVKMKHNLCGNIYHVAPSKFLQVGRRCPKCNGGVRSNHKEFLDKAKNFNYKILGVYSSNKTPLLVECKTCLNRTMMRPDNLLSGKGCKMCANAQMSDQRTFTTGEFVRRVRQLVGDEYIVIGEYNGADEKVLLEHTTCGNTYSVSPNKFIHGNRRCPVCAESSGESLVRKHLEFLKVEFKSQYWFNDCRNILPLPFDFAIFECEKLVGLIEYQGQQHYKPVEVFGGLEGHLKTVRNDKIKFEYCQVNNIPLLQIKYDEIVEDKINDFLKCYANPEPSTLETV